MAAKKAHSTNRRGTRFDRVDLLVLDALQQNAKVTNARLAEMAGISPASMLERVRKLERAGVIRGYVAMLEPREVGRTITAIVTVRLREHGYEQVESFKEAVSGFEEVQSCWHMAGEADFMLKVLARDMADYERFVVEDLSGVPNVGRVQSNFCLDTVKDSVYIPVAGGDEDVEG